MNDIVGCASPASRQLYQTLLNAVRAFGTFEEQRKKTSVHLSRRSAFAGVQFRREYLILILKSEQPIESGRVRKCEQASRNRWHCEIKVQNANDFDAELMKWIKDAYTLSA